MLKLLHQNDPALRHVPPKVVPTINKLIDVSGPESPPVQGFVVFVEKNDLLTDLNALVGRDLNRSLEGVFYAGDCLVGVVLWGNSGDGVSVVCPDEDGYADEILTVLKNHLSEGGDRL